MKEGKYRDAAAAFRAVVESQPTMANAHLGLIRSLLRAGRMDDAEEAAKHAVAVLPNSPLVHASFGDVAFRQGKFSDAEREYKASLKLDANAARGWLGLGKIYEIISMDKHAKDAYTRAHELDPEDEQIFEHWTRFLTLPERLDAVKKHAGVKPSGGEGEYVKLLSAAAAKKPWILTTEVKPVEIKMQPYGKELVGVYDINRDGPMNISKGYGLNVKFNDRASAVLLLDTGAGGITIGRKLAEKAGAVKISDTFIYGIGDQGAVASYEAWIDKIVIGGLEFHNCIVTVSSRNNVADEAGLIGADVFRKFLVTLDFHEWKMQLRPLPTHPEGVAEDDVAQDRYIAPEMQSYSKFFRFGHDIVVPVVVNDKAVGNFILDTGADLNSLTARFATQVTKASADGDYEMRGVSGRVQQVLTGKKAILQFAKMRIESHDMPVFATDTISQGEGTEIAGLIGIRTLVQMKMTIDYRDGLVDLQVYDFKKARE